ncbi:hypothetical protein [Marinobacterium sp. xm-a-152]|uniref:hypothetical protein n=1 Tax=Marinobacterium sp. xm-a-152 TaxID=2497733 RepID=UPI0015696FF0|nr:hypothetical protein [Marinobacterium sp. xm-a-152]NRP15017.1 hypothetical protein [Marinobacterium sp. xm-a-152]
MIETLLGGLLGGAFRLTPEILKWIDRKGERQHDLAIQDRTLQLETLRLKNKQATEQLTANRDIETEGLKTFQSAITAQGQQTQVGWVDALSSSVRPVITYWFMALYCATKLSLLTIALNNGQEISTSIANSWTDSDQALWAGVLNFWFLGRVFDKLKF